MFIKKFDWLSPPITLYFKGENQHGSLFSAILSMICYILVLISGIYYSRQFIKREDPKAYFFNRYVLDAGFFPVNSSSMFNFIQVSDQSNNKITPFDFTAFRVVGLDNVFYDDYMKNPDILANENHWVYGYCNNNTDTEGIGHLIDFDYFEQSACIRKYYDKNKKTYFNTDDPEFRWPVIEKGCSNPERTYYGIIIQRCDKSPNILKSQGPECKSEEEITNVINKVSLNYQLIDNYADMLNYEIPFTKYFYEVTSAITNGVYIINHLNFNPAKMITHNGLILEHIEEVPSYFFTQNEKHTIDKSVLTEEQTTNGCLIGIYFWMQNTLQHFERNYNRIQDILSDIGGVSSIVVTLGYYTNLLVHNYIIVLDTQELVLSRDNHNYKGKTLKRKPTILRKANELVFFEKKTNKNINDDLKKQSSSNVQRFIKDENETIKNINKINSKKENTNIYLTRKKKSNIYHDKNKDKDISINKINSQLLSEKDSNNIINNNCKDNKNEKKTVNIMDLNEIKENEDFENRPLEKQKFNWFKYIWYLICGGKNNQKIAYYEDFRAKLISEENIIQNYLDIYRLLKANNLQKVNI